MNIQDQIIERQEAIAEFMKQMPSDLTEPIAATFDDFVAENGGSFVNLFSCTGHMNYAFVPESTYPEDNNHFGYVVRLYHGADVRFQRGDRPRAMRGSLFKHNRTYEDLDAWQSQILKRYVRQIDRPTLIYKQELIDYADSLRKRLRERRALRGKCVHTGRRIPAIPGDLRATTRDYGVFFGVDDDRIDKFGETRIMIKGKPLTIKRGEDIGLWRGKLSAIKRLHKEIHRLEKV